MDLIDSIGSSALNARMLLATATKKVPVVRYAIGLSAISMLATTTIGYAKNPAGAFVSLMVTLALMVVLFIIGAATRLSSGHYTLPILVLVWSLILFFIFWVGLLTSSVAGWGPQGLADRLWRQYGDDERQQMYPGNASVISNKEAVLVLRGDFEAVEKNPQTASDIASRGAQLNTLLGGIPDASIDVTRQILKYEYAGWAALISARVTEDAAKSRQMLEAAADRLEHAHKLMGDVARKYGEGVTGYAELYDFILGASGDLSRTRWLLAVTYAAQSKNHRTKEPAESIKMLKMIDDGYLSKYPPNANEYLAWAMETEHRKSTKTDVPAP